MKATGRLRYEEDCIMRENDKEQAARSAVTGDATADAAAAGDAVTGDATTDGAATGDAAARAAVTDDAAAGSAPKRRSRNKAIMIVTAIVVVAVLGSAFWVWHNTPGFCNAVCHSPMDPALATYGGSSGQEGVDKWGNVVPDAGSLLCVSHKESADATCLTCHIPTMEEQIGEVVKWTTGDYYFPLEERSLEELNAYGQRERAEGLCLNESCHNMNRDDLARATSMLVRNPHETVEGHPAFACSDCHKAHRESVNACSGCHADALIPDGWLTVAEGLEKRPGA